MLDLVNLHVHKKNLKKFQPKEFVWKQDKKQALFIPQKLFWHILEYSSYPYFTGDTLEIYAQHICMMTPLMDPDQVMKRQSFCQRRLP